MKKSEEPLSEDQLPEKPEELLEEQSNTINQRLVSAGKKTDSDQLTEKMLLLDSSGPPGNEKTISIREAMYKQLENEIEEANDRFND